MVDRDLIFRKLQQIDKLLDEIKDFLAEPFEKFIKNTVVVRAAERNFQLIIDIASDVNAQIFLERENGTPDTYKQSFTQLAREKVIPHELAGKLVNGAKIRNILVHEYDFEEDYEKFYTSAKEIIPAFREYLEVVYAYIQAQK